MLVALGTMLVIHCSIFGIDKDEAWIALGMAFLNQEISSSLSPEPYEIQVRSDAMLSTCRRCCGRSYGKLG
jgi:hypothetical protein